MDAQEQRIQWAASLYALIKQKSATDVIALMIIFQLNSDLQSDREISNKNVRHIQSSRDKFKYGCIRRLISYLHVYDVYIGNLMSPCTFVNYLLWLNL